MKAPRSRALPTASAPAADPEANEIISGGASPTPTASATAAPETGAYRDVGNKVRQATWQSPVTSRLLVEAGLGTYSSRWGGVLMPGSPAGDLVRVTEQCATAAGCANNGGIANLTYRSPNVGDELAGLVQLARVGLVRARRPEHEVRLSGRLPDGQPEGVFQQRVPVVPDAERRPGPAHRNDRPLSDPAARPLRRVLRAGGVDDGPR